MKNTINGKRAVPLLCSLILILSLAVSAYAAGGPSDEDLKDIGSRIEYPRSKEYLDDYVFAVVEAPKGHSVYGYGSADRQGTKYQVLDGEIVMILARRGQMSCCIVLSESAGRWINSDYLLIDGKKPEHPDGPNAWDLKDINSHIEYPRDKEYLSEYKYAIVEAPKGHSVYGYGSADRQGSKYTVLDGKAVQIIAVRGKMSCCIVLEDSVGRWINSEYLREVPESEVR